MKNYIILTILMLPVVARAEVTDELKRLNKCYGLFVRERIPTDHTLWKQVAAGTKSGTDACMEIFDKAKITNGEIAKDSSGNYDAEGAKVLASFLRFHKSQFEIPDYATMVNSNLERFTRDVVDSNESTYHFLYSLFVPDQKFSDVVTRDYSIRAKRFTTKSVRARSVAGVAMQDIYQGVFKQVKNADGFNITVPDDTKGGAVLFQPTLQDTGTLIGLDIDTDDNSIEATHFDPNFGSYKLDSRNVNQHLGAGVIGTQAYLSANLGKDGFVTGGTNLYRRWGKHVLSDLLCRDLPALRTKDVVSEVDSTSTIAFRTGISCMACHSSMDPLAGTVRNVKSAWSHNIGVDFNRVKFWGQRPADLAAAPFPVKAADANFYRRPNQGKLFFRSYDGELISQDVQGLDQLGQTIAATNDLYVCAAKRYYRFLTGITVSLADSGNINTPVFSEGEKFQRNRVINWGLKLKEHQSLRTLIKTIVESPAFIYPDRGV
jgi:hypothetical protein